MRGTERLPEPLGNAVRQLYSTVRRHTVAVRRRTAMPQRPFLPEAPFRLLVGPANQAGQGWAWARAAERTSSAVAAQVLTVRRNEFGYDSDYVISSDQYRNPRWQQEQERYVTTHFSHVLIEALRPILGNRYGSDCRGDLRFLSRHGISTALVVHGSEIRLPSRHAQREKWSPFAVVDDFTGRLERQARRNGAIVGDFAGPKFVSTPDLLVDVPGAHWLPVVVEPEQWATEAPVLRRLRPVVIHAPSQLRLKGTACIDRAMERLDASGVIEYRRIAGVPHARMPSVLSEADIVIDQVLMGLYGVAACEAMAAERVVVSYVGSDVRGYVRRETGRSLPIMEATPETISDVVIDLVTNRAGAREAAAEGVSFVREIHDGRVAGLTLAAWLGESPA